MTCKNCGGHFTELEMASRRPPLHRWELTAVGARVALENAGPGGDNRLCPACGCATLR